MSYNNSKVSAHPSSCKRHTLPEIAFTWLGHLKMKYLTPATNLEFEPIFVNLS